MKAHLGTAFRWGAAGSPEARWVRIVGVVDDVNYLWIDRSIEPVVYLNAVQMPTAGAIYVLATGGFPHGIGGRGSPCACGIGPNDTA